MAFEQIPLLPSAPGTHSSLAVHRFGPAGGKKVYIQAGLHADEHPGLLVAQHIIRHLMVLDKAKQLTAEFIVVPFANPIGLRQKIFGYVNGRCDLATGQNFNRDMAVNRSGINESLVSSLTKSAAENDVMFRQWLLNTVEQRTGNLEIDHLHKKLLSLSLDANFVFDLHCDDRALTHLFYGSHQKNDGQLLASFLHTDVCLEEDVTGTVAFDGTHTQPWVLAERLAGKNIFESPCFAATLELRGQRDVNPTIAEQDTLGLLSFCAAKGLIADWQAVPTSSPQKTIDVNQVKMVTASATGIVTYQCQLKDIVSKGDKLAEIVLLDQPEPTTVEVIAPCDGYVFSQTEHYLVSPGHTLLMLATNEQQQAAGTQLAF